MEPVITAYKENDLVWAKMKGFSPWPGKVARAPPEMRKAPKKSVALECIYFFGTRNYAWIEHQNIKPYATFKDDLVKASKTGAFREACHEIEEYIKDPEKYEAAQPKGPTVISVEEQFNRLRDGDANGSNSDHSEPEPSSSKTPPKKETPKPKSILVKRKAQDTPTLSNKQRKSDSPSTSARRKRNSSSVSLINDTMNAVASTSRGNPLLNRPVVRQPETPELDMTENLMKITKRNITPSTKTFGFLGLGIMGSAIVRNMLHSGHKVIVWNRTADKCRKFVDAGALYAKTPCDVVSDADITFACVADPQASKDIVFGNCGVLQAENGVGGYVELSTIDPETSQDICEAITGKGGKYLEVQLQGSKPQAETGDLIILGAGHRELFSECQSCFQSIARNSFFMGDVGNACKVNLIIQCMIGVNLAGLAEGLSLADRCGVNLQDVLDIIQLTTFSSQLVVQKAKEMFGNTFIPNQPLAHMQKDLRLALGMAEVLEHSMPTTAVTNEVYKHAKRLGYGKHDTSAVYNCLNEIDKIPRHGDDSPLIETEKNFTQTKNTSSASCRLAHLSNYFSEDFRPAITPIHVYMNTSELKKISKTSESSSSSEDVSLHSEENKPIEKNIASDSASPAGSSTPSLRTSAGSNIQTMSDAPSGPSSQSMLASAATSSQSSSIEDLTSERVTMSLEEDNPTVESSIQSICASAGSSLQSLSASAGTSSTISHTGGISSQSMSTPAITSSQSMSTSASTSSKSMSVSATKSQSISASDSISFQLMSASAGTSSLAMSSSQAMLSIAGGSSESMSPSSSTRSQSKSYPASTSLQALSAGSTSQTMSTSAGPSSQATAGTCSQSKSTSAGLSLLRAMLEATIPSAGIRSQSISTLSGTSSLTMSTSVGTNSQSMSVSAGTSFQSMSASTCSQATPIIPVTISETILPSAGTSLQTMPATADCSVQAISASADTSSRVMSASAEPTSQAMLASPTSSSQAMYTSADTSLQTVFNLAGTSSETVSPSRSQSRLYPSSTNLQAMLASAGTSLQRISASPSSSSRAMCASADTSSQAMLAIAGSSSETIPSPAGTSLQVTPASAGPTSQAISASASSSSQAMFASADTSSQAVLNLAGTSSETVSPSASNRSQSRLYLPSTSLQAMLASADTSLQGISASPGSSSVLAIAGTSSQSRSYPAEATSASAGLSLLRAMLETIPSAGIRSQSQFSPGTSSQSMSASAGTSLQAMLASAGPSSQAMCASAGTSSETTSADISLQETLASADISSQDMSLSTDISSQAMLTSAGTSSQAMPAGGPSSSPMLAVASTSLQAMWGTAGTSSQAMTPIASTSSQSMPILGSFIHDMPSTSSDARASSRQRSHSFPICKSLDFPNILFTGKPPKYEPFIDKRKIKMPWSDSSSDESNPNVPPEHCSQKSRPNVSPEFDSAQSPIPSTSFTRTNYASTSVENPISTANRRSKIDSYQILCKLAASFAGSVQVAGKKLIANPLWEESSRSNTNLPSATAEVSCIEIDRSSASSQGAEKTAIDLSAFIFPPISISHEVTVSTSINQSDLSSSPASVENSNIEIACVKDCSLSITPLATAETEPSRVLKPSDYVDETQHPKSMSSISGSQIAAPLARLPSSSQQPTETANLNPEISTPHIIPYTTNSLQQPVRSFREFARTNEPSYDTIESDSCSSEMFTHSTHSPKRARLPSTLTAQAQRSQMTSPTNFNFRPIHSPASLLPSFFQLGRALSSPQLTVNISDSNSISIPSFPVQPSTSAFNQNIDMLTPPNTSLDFVSHTIPTESVAVSLPVSSVFKRVRPSTSTQIDDDNAVGSADSISPPMPSSSARDFPLAYFAKRARTLSPPHFLGEDSTDSAESMFFRAMEFLPIYTVHRTISPTELARKFSPLANSKASSESNSSLDDAARLLREIPNAFMVRSLIITLSEGSSSTTTSSSLSLTTTSVEPYHPFASLPSARALVRVAQSSTNYSASEASSTSPISTVSLPATSYFRSALMTTPPQDLADEANSAEAADSNVISSASDTIVLPSCASTSESSSQCFPDESSSHYPFSSTSVESMTPQDNETNLVNKENEDEDSL